MGDVYTLLCFRPAALSKTFGLRNLIYSTERGQIRNRYNQAPHLAQDTNGKVTTSKLDITNESQVVSLFAVGGHNASTNRRV